MPSLDLEQKGLLYVLERVERGEGQMAPSMRYGLVHEGLIRDRDPVALSPLGVRVLQALRQRSLTMTGEVPRLDLADLLKID